MSMQSKEGEGAERPESGPLAGVRVIELGMVMQVPLAGQMLGDLGADVIKVERLPPGEILRTLDPVGHGQDRMSCYFAALCGNKRSLSLNIKSDTGKAVLMRLIDSADVLLHNFRPGVMERLGLGYPDLSERNPRLIYAEGSAFGADGPMASMPGQDMLAQCFSGLARSGRDEDAAPQIGNAPYVDYLTASSLTQGILAAIIERHSSGRGQKVATSLLDNAMAAQTLEVASLSMHGQSTSWLKQAMMLRTLDGWLVVLTLFRSNPLRGICAAFEQDDFSSRPEFATLELQIENLHEIARHFQPIVARLTTAQCVERLSARDVLCSPVHALSEALDHPQLAANGALRTVDLPDYGPVKLVANPVKLSRTPVEMRQKPPELGSDGAEVLVSLGYAPSEVSTLMREGVVHLGSKRGSRQN